MSLPPSFLFFSLLHILGRFHLFAHFPNFPLSFLTLSLITPPLTAYSLFPSLSLSSMLYILPASPPTVAIRKQVLMLQLFPPEPAQYISGWTDMPESSCQQRVYPGDWPTWRILIPSAKPREKKSTLFLNNWRGEGRKSQDKHQDSTMLMLLLRRGRQFGGYLFILHGPWTVCLLILKQTISECNLLYC